MSIRLFGRAVRQICCAVVVCVGMPASLAAQSPAAAAGTAWADDPPALSSLVAFARLESDLRVAVTRYVSDRAAILRRYEVQYSPVRHERLRRLHAEWLRQLAATDFDGLNHEGQVDYILLRNRITHDQATLDLDDRRWTEMRDLVPFAARLREVAEARLDRTRADGRAVAGTLDEVASEVTLLTRALNDAGGREAPAAARGKVSPAVANRAAQYVAHVRQVMGEWHTFYKGYDPIVSWWVAQPMQRLDATLDAYAGAITRHLVGIRPGEAAPIVGDPVKADGLAADLAVEMIPYGAEELLEIGWKEFRWIEAEFRKVATAMGYGNDWKAALEHVKNLAPPPGEKPWAIFEIADYSKDFIGTLDAITIAPLAEEVWRLAMQTPERQLVNPFFTGGEVTRVSYPTDTMSHQDKLMSMRGNTPSFNFATVHHELIPGHHYQAFTTSRFNTHRSDLMRTPFWGEGWALYWELMLWDAGFPRNDADRIGMLFWRLHRAARIVFSLQFQLGEWTPQQAIDFLVDRVGHERANAEAEVRRSARDAPLYQLAYMVGGLQFRALYEELVPTGRMTAREFHNRVLLSGRMPVEMVRAILTGQPLTREYRTQWRFADN